jgi:putative chitinase
MITTALLISAGVLPTQARIWSAPLEAACQRFEILAVDQLAGFLAQAMHESARFTRLEENLMYSNPARIADIFRSGFDLNRDRRIQPEEIEFARAYVDKPRELACRAYAGRNGNGDEASGDGWLFRGSGPFQLTGRGNFQAFSHAIGVDYVANPDLVRQVPDAGAMAAGWFWAETGCNDIMAGHGDFDATTKRINGPAMLGAAERRALFYTCRQVFA